MATKPKSNQGLKIGKSKLKLWYLVPAVALVAIIGLIVVRISGASGKVWTVDSLTTKGNVVTVTKSNGSKYMTVTGPGNVTSPDISNNSSVTLKQTFNIGAQRYSSLICADIAVTSPSASLYISTFMSSVNTPTLASSSTVNGSIKRTYVKGDYLVCSPVESSRITSAYTDDRTLAVFSGTVNVRSFREYNSSTAEQTWYAYTFQDANNKGNLLPQNEYIYSNGSTLWDAKAGRSAYVSVAAFNDSPWPGTLYCADVTGVAATSSVRMDGVVMVMNKPMGGGMSSQTKSVAKGSVVTVCAGASDQKSTVYDYVISPTINVVSGEVTVSKIYKKQ